MNKRTRRAMWIWIVGGLIGAILLVFVIGALLPENYRARGHVDLDVTPDELWVMLEDFESHPMSASMARSVEPLPAENGLPVWIEDMGSSKVRVATVLADRPGHLVRELMDQVVPMTTRVELRIEPRGSGCRVHLDNHTVLRNGRWCVPVFRVLIALTNGIRGGMRAWLAQTVGKSNVVFTWE